MSQLVDILERFNRKERNLLIRDILGCQDKPLPLEKDFRARLAEATALPAEVLEHAWWTTDFHFDWLAGALLTFVKGETLTRQPKTGELVKGNQEDLDLLVVAHDPAATVPYHLILIEAKAYGHFTSGQYGSKVTRLEQLYGFYRELDPDSVQINFHYVLYSPTKPTKLVPKHLPWNPVDPAAPPTIQHMPLKLARQKSSILAVTRCNERGVPDEQGQFWRCIEVP